MSPRTGRGRAGVAPGAPQAPPLAEGGVPLSAAAGEAARFLVVGTAGYLANLAAFAALVRWPRVPSLPAACAAFAVGWLLAFAGHRRWTFPRGVLTARRQGGRYLAVSALTLAIDLALLRVLERVGAAPVLAQAVALGIATPASFLLNRGWAFR